jgi:diketogulonate reductase-like aldo/keto reductase
VKTALALGYRHVDTAKIYGNESDVGKAIRDSGVPRSEVFVTTKLWNADHGYDKAIRACHESLKRLGFEQVDLYLVHWPVAKLRHESWRALVTLQQEGMCRAIGVSNYTVRHLKELLDRSPVVPSVNQVELSPFLYQKERCPNPSTGTVSAKTRMYSISRSARRTWPRSMRCTMATAPLGTRRMRPESYERTTWN